jgi:hypothetical protein
MYLAFCYNVKPRMMNNILFTKKPNKQKNIEKCSHILHTHTTGCRKWSRAHVQPEVASPEVASPDMKSPEVVNRKWKGDNFPRFFYPYFPRFFSGALDSTYPVMQLPVMQLPVAHAHAITSGTPTNDKWMVLLYYLRYLITPLLSSNVSMEIPITNQLSRISLHEECNMED